MDDERGSLKSEVNQARQYASGAEPSPKQDRYGSPTFYALVKEIADLHHRKSHDYASDDNPYGNYHFAGHISSMFAHSPEDAGFAGRVAEKIYRLANLEKDNKKPLNESIEDTEKDIATIVILWMASRRDKRAKGNPLQEELYDLIKLMPDFQVNDLLGYISQLIETRSSLNIGAQYQPGDLDRAVSRSKVRSTLG